MVMRRFVVGGGVLAGAGALAAYVYAQAPFFWNQYLAEMRRGIGPAPNKPDWKQWPETGLHAAWLGHSTVLMKIDGFYVLTDPVFSDIAGLDILVTTVGTKRLVRPALDMKELPPIDLILLSHAHMDHFDIPSLRALHNKATAVVTASKTADLLQAGAYRSVQEVGWGERANAGPLRIQGLQVNHWGARVRSDTYRGYNGYLIETSNRRIIFGGDTAWTEHFQAVKTSRPVDLAIMPIGAYDPWIRVHCNPEQAWDMAAHAGADRVMPIHHQTFQLSREPIRQPIERLLEHAGREASRVVTTEVGAEVSIG